MQRMCAFLAFALMLSVMAFAVSEVESVEMVQENIIETKREELADLCAHYGFCGENLVYKLDDDGTLTIIGTGAMDNWDYPDYAPWYSSYRSSIRKVVISDGVASIGDYAFFACENLESVVIPNSVTSIGSAAFASCANLVNAAIPGSVESIGGFAFEFCESLVNVVVPEGVTSIGHYAFRNCTSLESLVIADSVKSIEGCAFSVCTNLTSISFGENPKLAHIGVSVFEECTKLSTVDIPESVNSIGAYAFYNCTSLAGVKVPGCETAFGKNVFYNCPVNFVLYGYAGSTAELYADNNNISFGVIEKIIVGTWQCGENLVATLYDDGLFVISGTGAMTDWDYPDYAPWHLSYRLSIKKVVISDGVTSIGDYSFINCSNLSRIEIPASVTSIGEYAFSHCASLANIEIPASVTSVGFVAFRDCTSLESITVDDGNTNYSSDESGVLFDKNKTTIIRYPIGNTGKSYEIPASVTSITGYAFANCCNLESITVNGGNTSFVSDEQGVLFNNDKSRIVQYPVGNTATSYKIPDSVMDIDNSAFESCKSLVSVTFGDKPSLKRIGYSVFGDCVSLESIVIPDSVSKIGDWAFTDCISLEGIEIPKSVNDIGSFVFQNCTNLKNITIFSREASFGYSVFYNCSPLLAVCGYAGSTAETYANSENIVFEAIYERSIVETWQAGENVTATLYDDGTLEFDGVGEMTNWNNYSSVPWSSYRTSIKKVLINNEVTKIGKGAFYSCSSLANVAFEENSQLTSIDDYAFDGCSNLSDFQIPNGVVKIGDYAFSNSGLERIQIPESITSIGEGAFHGCMSLISIDIPKSVTSIDYLVFSYCISLSNITVDENNANYSSDERGALFDKNKTTLIQYPIGNSATSYEIPASVTNISPYAFECSNLLSIKIPKSVTNIGRYAFMECSNLLSVKIPKSVTNIGEGAFFLCIRLTNVTIYNREAIFGTGVFYSCSDDLTLYGYTGSTTETYAKTNSIPFRYASELKASAENKKYTVSVIYGGSEISGKIAAAMYSDNGKLAEIQLLDAEETVTVEFENEVSKGNVKFMWLSKNDTMTPMCENVTLEIQK